MDTTAIATWQQLLRQFKESLAKRLWAIPGLSEAEKEIVFKNYLVDLENFERDLAAYNDDTVSREKAAREENDLLRSLLGVPGEELRTRTLQLTVATNADRVKISELEEELGLLKTQLAERGMENEVLRKRVRELEEESSRLKSQHYLEKDTDIKFFTETKENLKNQLLDLENRLANLRALFADNNRKLAEEKQEEISLLQQKILQEMEDTVRKNRQLSWAEEDMFAKGVAQRVRTVLVSAQGQLFLTMERLGLLDPESKSETFWRGRFKIFTEGAEELGRNFKSLHGQLQDVTKALDDYLHLTNRREIVREPVSVVELVKRSMAELYLDRQAGLSFEFHPDDPLPDVIGDPTLLQFVVNALLQNAREALPHQSGRITIKIKNRSKDGHIEFLIQDTGAGIPDHLKPRLFQPFFTTKEGRQGLSLSRARRLVELHGGTLVLLDSTPSGTAFQMNLRLKGER